MLSTKLEHCFSLWLLHLNFCVLKTGTWLIFDSMLNLRQKKKSARGEPLVHWRLKFRYIDLLFLLGILSWPHLWPSTELDYVETMFTRASESTDFGLKSPEKPCKLSKKLPIDLSGRRSRKFESCHLDHFGCS